MLTWQPGSTAAPYWLDKPTNLVLAPDENGRLVCRANGNPKPNIQWLINGQPVDSMYKWYFFKLFIFFLSFFLSIFYYYFFLERREFQMKRSFSRRSSMTPRGFYLLGERKKKKLQQRSGGEQKTICHREMRKKSCWGMRARLVMTRILWSHSWWRNCVFTPPQ